MEKISASAFLLLVALSYTLAKETTVKPGAKKDSRPKLPQTLSRGGTPLLVGSQVLLIWEKFPDSVLKCLPCVLGCVLPRFITIYKYF